MAELDKLTAEKILSIKLPEKLYSGSSIGDIKKVYRKLSALWHPDKHIVDKIDTTVPFMHIKNLYEKAIEKIENGTWNLGQVVFFNDVDGKKYQMKYQVMHNFDLGQCYISKNFITWVFEKDYSDLMNRGIKNYLNLNYANETMKKEMTKYLPEIYQKIETKDKSILIMKKNSDFILIKDILNYYNGKMPVKHMAWIISSMYNMACFMQYNNLMHGGFSLDNYYINPENHEGCLAGGWWFSHSLAERLVALNKTAIDVAPIIILNTKKADIGLDLEMIKLVGRQLLGDSSGVYLNKNKEIPEDIVTWLRNGAGKDAVSEYEKWHKVLTKSFGVRRFTKMDLTDNDIYSKGE